MNGRKVVVQVNFIENYISVTGTSHNSRCYPCVHRLLIAPLNPFVIVSDDMGHEKLAVNCFLAKIIGSLKAKHPRLTASTSFQMVHAARSNRSSCL